LCTFEDQPVGHALEARIRRLQELYWSEVDPDGRGFVPLADALRRAEDYTEARRVLEEGLARHPESASGHVVSAWLHLDQGEPEEAETSFGFVLDLDPKNVSALSGLGDLLEGRGELVEALGHFRNLLEETPADGELRDKILGLEAQLEEGTEGPAEDEAILPEVGSPGAFARFADELDWERATLQEDRPYLGSTTEVEDWVRDVDDHPVWLAEDGVPIPEVRDRQDALVTPTLGEIYFRQGLLGRAEEVFEALLERDPGNKDLAARLEAVRAAQRGEPQDPEPTSLEDQREHEPTPAESPEADGPQAHPVATLETEEPDVVSVDTLGPGESAVVSAEDLRPDDSKVLAIESLAPDPSRILDIHELAPSASEVVPVEILTPGAPPPAPPRRPDPEEVVPIQSLAPGELDVVSIEALAPDPSVEEDGGPGDDPRLHAFQDWLDELP
jgi:tetratricopeptide (TPR) repeat protein